MRKLSHEYYRAVNNKSEKWESVSFLEWPLRFPQKPRPIRIKDKQTGNISNCLFGEFGLVVPKGRQ